MGRDCPCHHELAHQLQRAEPAAAAGWQLWNGLNRVLEPVYGRVRRILPSMAGIDFAPLVVLLAILAAEIVVRNNLYSFG